MLGADVGLVIKLPLQDGSEYEWYVARPQGLLRKFAAHSPALRRLLCKLKTSPEDLADIIHYIDDVSAGHLLAPVHGRTFTTYRYTFKQFGSHLLSCQQCWLEYGILRVSVVEKVVGGPSYVLRVLMHQFFTSAENFTTTGVFVNCGEGELIFAKNGGIIADRKAHMENFDLKGASGMSPCERCANVVKKGAFDGDDPIPNPGGKLVDVTCLDPALCVPNTDETLYAHADDLASTFPQVAAKRLTKRRFELAEMAVGINYNPHGLIWDRSLRSICPVLEMKKDDWAHIYLCKGIGGDELWNLLQRMKRSAGCVGFALETALREELITWAWPLHRRSDGNLSSQIFSNKRAESNKEAGAWKSGAGEFLCVAPVVLYFADKHFTARLPNEVASFRRLCKVIDYIIALKSGAVSDTKELRRLVHEHHYQHALVYGKSHFTPKWHDSMHLPDQYEADGGVVFDTLCNERDHQNAKSFAELMRGRKLAFERYVLARSIAWQMKALEEFSELPSLVGPEMWVDELGAYLASRLKSEGVHVAVGDYVVTDQQDVVEVSACGRNGSRLFLLGDVCQARPPLGQHLGLGWTPGEAFAKDLYTHGHGACTARRKRHGLSCVDLCGLCNGHGQHHGLSCVDFLGLCNGHSHGHCKVQIQATGPMRYPLPCCR